MQGWVLRPKTVIHLLNLFQLFIGTFPLSDVTLMTQEERNEFIPPIRTLIDVLEDNNANPEQTNILLKQSMKLTELMSRM